MADAVKTRFFFDKQIVVDAVGAKTAEAMGRSGNSIKLIAQRSMKYRKKPSPPGSPPSAHKDGRRGALMRDRLFNEYDTGTKTQVIGPEGMGRAVAPRLNEAGGSTTVKAIVRRPAGRQMSPAAKAAFRQKILQGAIAKATPIVVSRAAHYPARPYMGPALRMEQTRYPQRWAGTLKKV